MPNPMDVNPDHLRLSADQINMHNDRLTAKHGEANASIESALSGWVGRSGDALRAKLADLAAVDTHIAEELTRHDDLLRYGAYNYESMDDHSMAEFINTEQAI